MKHPLLVFAVLLIWVSCLVGCRSSNESSQRGEDGPNSGSSPSQEQVLKGIVTAKPAETPELLAEKKEMVQQSLVNARNAISVGDLEKSVKILEDTVMLDASNRDVLFNLVIASRDLSKSVGASDAARSYRLANQAGAYLKSLEEYHSDITPDERAVFADILFDIACAHARSNRHEEFSGAFSSAIASGFDDWKRIRTEPDFATLRTYPDMESRLNETTKEVESRVSESARKRLSDFKPVEFSLQKLLEMPAAKTLQDVAASLPGKTVIITTNDEKLGQLKLRQLGDGIVLQKAELDDEVLQKAAGVPKNTTTLVFDVSGKLRWFGSGKYSAALVEAIAVALLHEKSP